MKAMLDGRKAQDEVFLVVALISVTDLSDDVLHLGFLLCCALLIRHQLLEMSWKAIESHAENHQ